MFCCSITSFVITIFCVLIIASFLLLFFIGNVAVFPEFVKLQFVACWCYAEALYRWFVPRKCKNIAGLTALITGGGHGIGRQIALGLIKKGAKVVLWDINQENMNKVVREIEALKGQGYSYICDVTKKDDVYEVARKVKLDVGNVDILVNNAGVVTGRDFLSCLDEDIEKTINVNLLAHFWTLKAFLSEMVERDQGHIVAIASIMGLLGVPRLVDYCVSKTGVIMMMEALRQEMVCQNKQGVHFTTILPTKVDTGLFEGAKARFGSLPPTVKPEYIAKKTIEAVERNEMYLVLPPWLAPTFALKPFLPQKLIDACLKFTELDKAMEEFTGHKKEN